MKRRHPRPAGHFGPKGTPATLGLVVGGLLAAMTLSGCQVMSPLQTNIRYEPADGVAVDLGDVLIRDLLVISNAKGGAGTLSGMVVNRGAKPVTITFAAGETGGSTRAQVLAGAQSRLSGTAGVDPVTLPAIDAAAGDVVTITVSTPAGGASEVSVPVLRADGYYATLAPPPPAS